jgi:glutamate formiminotransferase / 5-formyltetrahydrofolate cyclo-ligase
VPGLVALARAVVQRIDLRHHRGVHPRTGALDVVPFVPLAPGAMPDAIDAAHRLGRALGDQLELPVFLYGAASTGDAGAPAQPSEAKVPADWRQAKVPADWRRVGLPAIAAALDAGELTPDYGPPRAHPTAGIVLAGARGLLVAYNLLLFTADVSVARKVARALRERDGGLPGVQALGFHLESRGRAQVSINLLRPDQTPLRAVVERAREVASALGVEIDRGELVGLAPEAAVAGATAQELLLPELGPAQILEQRLAALPPD